MPSGDTIPANGVSERKDVSMARRRYQRGSISPKPIGKKEKYWLVRWREDEFVKGEIERLQKSERLLVSEYPTRRSAERGLDAILRRIGLNDPGYKARPPATVQEFFDKWKDAVLKHKKPSTQASTNSRMNKVLLPLFGKRNLSDLSAELLQGFISDRGGNAKTVKNLIGELRMMWKTATQWGYVTHDPFENLVYPVYQKDEQPSFTPEQVRMILEKMPEPYKTLWELVWEAGMRRGEVCALQVGDVQGGLVVIRRGVSCGEVVTPKSSRPRTAGLSDGLQAKLKLMTDGRKSDEWLFTNRKGKRLDPDNLVDRHLTPVVEGLNLTGAAHAFRHGNATQMDRAGVPMAIRQGRLGHVESATTMDYTHRISEDERKVANGLRESIQ
jgi:integrase